MADKKTQNYEQYVLNLVHDTDYNVLKVMPYGSDGTNAIAIPTNTGGVKTIKGYPSTAFSVTINSADASSATQVKAAAGASTYIYITDIMVSTDTELNFTIQDDAGTPNVIIENIYLAANGGFVLNLATPIKAPAANQDIDIVASDTGNVTVLLNGYTGT
jgi:hypothetical protein